MTKKKNSPTAPSVKERLVRNKRINIALNQKELKLLERFYAQYKIKNKSKFLRETIMKTVWMKMIQQESCLFKENEMK